MHSLHVRDQILHCAAYDRHNQQTGQVVRRARRIQNALAQGPAAVQNNRHLVARRQILVISASCVSAILCSDWFVRCIKSRCGSCSHECARTRCINSRSRSTNWDSGCRRDARRPDTSQTAQNPPSSHQHSFPLSATAHAKIRAGKAPRKIFACRDVVKTRPVCLWQSSPSCAGSFCGCQTPRSGIAA